MPAGDITTLFFRTPRLVATVLLVVLAAGASAFVSLGRQEDPTITNLFATIVTPFPGADAARVEALVTGKIEDELSAIAEIDTVESASRAGLSVVTVELSSFIDARRIEETWSRIRDALDDAALAFPRGAGEPAFDDDRTGAFTAILAVGTRSAAAPPSIAARTAEELADLLRGLPGTELVELYGAPREEILVEIDPDRLAATGLSADAVARRVAAADARSSAGRYRGERVEAVVEVGGEIDGIARVGEIPLAMSASGVATRVADVATVTKGALTPPAEIARMDGRDVVLVAARMEPGRRVDAYMERLRGEVDGFRERVAGGVEIRLVFDQSGYTADRLAEVATNMALGVALVLAVLFVTLGARAAFAVALVLPATALASLATLGFLGVPIHQMSVTGLIVALGLLVDAAIVMTDEIRKRVAAGLGAEAAVGGSVRRLAGPLFASTVTTALAFTPMAILPGPAGDFVGSIAIAVIVMLCWSFVLALTVTPAIAGWLLARRPPGGGRGGFLAAGVSPGPVGALFARLVRLSLAHPRLAILWSLVLPVSGFLAFPTLTAQFFPGVERDQLYVEVEMAPGTAIGATAAAAAVVDGVLRAEPDVVQVAWVVGRAAPAFYYNMMNDRDGAPDYARALVTTASPEATRRLLPTLQAELDGRVPDARVLVRGLVQGPPVDAPVVLRLVGPDLGTLSALGEELRGIVRRVPAITSARTLLGDSPPKFVFDLDEEKVRLAGLDLDGVSAQLDAALEGLAGGSLVEGTEELPVRVRVGAERRGDLAAILTLGVVPPGARGEAAHPGIPLAALGEARVETAPAVIHRRNGERVEAVEAFVAPGVLPQEALDDAAIEAAGFSLPDGYRLELGGDADARAETLSNLLAPMGLIVTLTIATVVLTFNAFRLAAIAGLVCVLSAGLSLLALAVFQQPFGIQAVIGVIGSIGVSINAAIVVMTALQADPDAAAGEREAMARVVLGSTRHILSTTVTTFGGFLPLILEGGGFWPPFAIAIAGGVLLSAVVSLFFTPPAFLLFGRRRRDARPAPRGRPAAAGA